VGYLHELDAAADSLLRSAGAEFDKLVEFLRINPLASTVIFGAVIMVWLFRQR
jgi:hypothetical protein